jgi:cardiolipin synthase
MHSLLYALFELEFGPIPGHYLLLMADLLALASVPSVLLHRRGRPASAMSWMLGVLLVPYLGFALWWLIGVERLRRKQRARQTSTEEFEEALEEVAADHASRQIRSFDPILPPGLFRAYGPLKIAGPTRRNRVELLVDGEDGFGAIERMIASAEHYVHLLFYIWQNDETGRRLRDMLVEKAREGVEVRVLVDAVGSPKFERQLAPPLLEAGGKVSKFLPPRYFAWRPTFNFRNHRKLVVADGRDAFIGGMNIGTEYEHDWHDLGMHLRGPAVRDLHEVFLDDWFFATEQNLASAEYLQAWNDEKTFDFEDSFIARDVPCTVLASGPDTDSARSAMHDAFYHAVNGARERVWIMTPYFVPDKSILMAMEAAVQRDIDVRLLLPRDGDVPLVRYASRSYYPMMLEAGVRIFEYLPRVLHAKSILIDQRFAYLGSANIDVRSFEIDFEIGGFFASSTLNDRLARVFEEDFKRSEEMSFEEIEKLGHFYKLRDAVAHLTSPML